MSTKNTRKWGITLFFAVILAGCSFAPGEPEPLLGTTPFTDVLIARPK